jgi:hypothetical protein
MAPWRRIVLSLAILAFLLAAAGSADVASGLPVLGPLLLRVGQMPFFWLGVFCFLAAVWRRGGG